MSEDFKKLKIPIVGISHCRDVAEKTLTNYVNKLPLFFKFEIDEHNEFDENAIKIMVSEDDIKFEKIGFVSKDVNGLLKQAIQDDIIEDIKLETFGESLGHIGGKLLVLLNLS